MADRYCLPDSYRANTSVPTIEADFGDYWNEERIARSMDYQYDVYAAARVLADRHSLVSAADFGCGVATKLNHFLGHLSPTGFDQPTVGTYIRKTFPRIAFRAIDLENPELHLSDADHFDLTICCDVIEHLLEPDRLMEALRTHTAGLVVLSTPERDLTRGPGATRCDKPEHVREWNQAEFGEYVRRCGFDVVEHSLVPKERLSEEERHERDRSDQRTRRWHGCQLVVARPR
jgi:SAM-dependent methyltransferase